MVALALAAGGAVAARATGDVAAHARESGARRAARATAQAFTQAIDGVARSVDTLVLVAPEVAARPAEPPLALSSLVAGSGIAAVAVVRGHPFLSSGSGDVPVVVAGALPEGVEPVALRTDLTATLDLSRDTGDPHAGRVGRHLAVAVPVFGGQSVTTAQRRAAVSAYVVAVVDTDALLTRTRSDAERIAIRAGGVLLTADVRRSGTSALAPAPLAGLPVEAVVDVPVEGGAPAVAWAMLLLGLVGAAGVVGVGLGGGHALRRAVAANDALERETRTVAEIGPLLQQSLDLAEVLPAVAVRLSDEFALESFAIELVGEHGDPVDVFSVGRRSTGEVAVVIGPDGIPAGTEVALPLLRAGRTIGRIRLMPREHLAPTQVDALRGAADLIAVATYNVELYEREQATVRRLQELDRLKDAFLGTISHELRTPITAIGGFSRMLNERWDDLTEDQRHDFIRRVGRNAASLGLLVDDLLDFARLERQALQTNVSPMPLDVVVAAFVAQVVPALGDHPVETDLAENVVALADPRAIERVLANLLTNAAKFSPAGSPIAVGLRQGDQSAILTVSDLGPGIAAEDRLRVFTRFYRGESDAARSTRGAGIGLAVVHELVTQMGGEIAVHPREPHGTTMLIRLPLAEPAEVEVDAPVQRAAAEVLIDARSKP